MTPSIVNRVAINSDRLTILNTRTHLAMYRTTLHIRVSSSVSSDETTLNSRTTIVRIRLEARIIIGLAGRYT